MEEESFVVSVGEEWSSKHIASFCTLAGIVVSPFNIQEHFDRALFVYTKKIDPVFKFKHPLNRPWLCLDQDAFC